MSAVKLTDQVYNSMNSFIFTAWRQLEEYWETVLYRI